MKRLISKVTPVLRYLLFDILIGKPPTRKKDTDWDGEYGQEGF